MCCKFELIYLQAIPLGHYSSGGKATERYMTDVVDSNPIWSDLLSCIINLIKYLYKYPVIFIILQAIIFDPWPEVLFDVGQAVFSQPTASYPIPQATATVFFRVEDKHVEPPEIKGVPTVRVLNQNYLTKTIFRWTWHLRNLSFLVTDCSVFNQCRSFFIFCISIPLYNLKNDK